MTPPPHPYHINFGKAITTSIHHIVMISTTTVHSSGLTLSVARTGKKHHGTDTCEYGSKNVGMINTSCASGKCVVSFAPGSDASKGPAVAMTTDSTKHDSAPVDGVNEMRPHTSCPTVAPVVASGYTPLTPVGPCGGKGAVMSAGVTTGANVLSASSRPGARPSASTTMYHALSVLTAVGRSPFTPMSTLLKANYSALPAAPLPTTVASSTHMYCKNTERSKVGMELKTHTRKFCYAK